MTLRPQTKAAQKSGARAANLPAILAIVADNVAEAAWLASVVVVALHFNLHTFTIFEADKIAMFKVLAALLLAALLLRISVWRYSGHTATASEMAAAIPPASAGIAVALLLSTGLSIAPQISWHGTYMRAHGAVMELCLLAVLVAQCVGLRRPAQLQRLLDTIVLAATISALYGILQHLKLDPAEWGQAFLGDRVSSTQGNPIFLGAYLVLTLPLTLACALQTLLRSTGGMRNHAQAALQLLSATMQGLAIWFTGSRGPLLGIAAGCLFMAICQAAALNNRKALLALFGVAGAVLLFLYALNIPNGPLEALRDRPYLGRLAHVWDTTNRTESSTQVRIETWRHAKDALLTTPALIYADGTVDTWSRLRLLIGYGPETAGFVLPPSYRTEFHNALFSDRAHNMLWDTLLTTGIIGAVAAYWLWATLANKLLLQLGFLTGSKNRYGLWALQFAGATAGLLITMQLRSPELAAVALALGLAAGTLMFPVLSTIVEPRTTQPVNFILLGLAGAAFAHFIEAQFGIATITTDLHFVIVIALIWNWDQLQQPTQITQPTPQAMTKQRQPSSFTAPAQPAMQALAVGTELAVPAVLAGILVLFSLWVPNLGLSSSAPAIALLLLACATAAAVFAYAHAPAAAATWALAGLGLGLPVTYLAWTQFDGRALAGSNANNILQTAAARSTSVSAFAIWIVLLTLGLGWALAQRESAPQHPVSNKFIFAPLAAFLIIGIGATYLNVNASQADTHRNLVQAANPADALTLLDRAVQLAPQQDELWYLYGRTALIAARAQTTQAARAVLRSAARSHLERALLISPFNPNYLISLARLNFDIAQDTQNLDDRTATANRADNYYAAALRLNPHDARWWQNWAVLDYEVFLDYAAAETKLQRAQTEDPTNARSLVLLGNVATARMVSPQANDRDFSAALDYYSQALNSPVGTSPIEIKLLLGNLWLQRGTASKDAVAQNSSYRMSADLFEQVISATDSTATFGEPDEQPGSAAKFEPWTLQRTLSQLYMSLQQYEQAGQYAALALASAPQSQHELLLQLQAASAAQLLANPRP